MVDPAGARAWNLATVSLRAMAVANALLLGYVHLLFAASNPDYYSQAWPSFSRALSDANVMFYGWIAAVAGVCQIIGGSTVAWLHRRQARSSPAPRASLILTLAWSLAAALGIVHYLHMTIVVNTPVHTVLSYVFFFGMTFFVVTDALATAAMRRTAQPAGELPNAPWRTAAVIVSCGLIFLVTFFVKDAAWNPWPSQTQKLFVGSEVAWVVLCHVYALLCVSRLEPRQNVVAGAFSGVTVEMATASGRDPGLAARSR